MSSPGEELLLSRRDDPMVGRGPFGFWPRLALKRWLGKGVGDSSKIGNCSSTSNVRLPCDSAQD